MSDNSFNFSISHTIPASKERVYQVLADMEAYPEFINDLISVRREGNLYHFVARAAILTVSATMAVNQVPGKAINFEMVEGPVERLSGQWRVEAAGRPGQTGVTLTIQAAAGARGQWLLRMTAKFIESKSDKLIAVFSNRALALEAGDGNRSPVPPVPAKRQDWLSRFKTGLSEILEQEETTKVPPGSGQPEVEGGADKSSVPWSEAPARPAFNLFEDEAQQQTLEALAAMLLPEDEFDAGVQHLGLAGVVEMRARYETGRAELYQVALKAVDRMAQAMFNRPSFVELAPAERSALLAAIRQNQVDLHFWGEIKPASFFSALWEDVVFLYCTHPETWARIGFPGPSFEEGGHPDFDKMQRKDRNPVFKP